MPRRHAWRSVAVAIGAGLMLSGCSKADVRQFLFGPTASTPPPAAAQPSPTPEPVAFTPPTTFPAPEPSPSPSGEFFPDNDNDVARVGAGVYFIECDGIEIPDSGGASEAPVGCRLHMDCTPRDGNNKPTRAKGEPHWYLSEPELVSGGPLSGDYTPTFSILREGELTLHVVIDGVRSDDVVVRFVR